MGYGLGRFVAFFLYMKQVDERGDVRFFGKLYPMTVAGALTHYYVIVYAVLVSCVYGVYLLWDKRIKETLIFCLTMALAGGTSLAVFPAMIQHFLAGRCARGCEKEK